MGLIINFQDRIFIDTNIYIHALEDKDHRGRQSRKIFGQIRLKTPHVYTSVITVSEILVEVFKNNLIDKVTEYLEFITADGLINVCEIDMQVSILSARIRAQSKKKIKTPDALQIASALSKQCNLFLTYDKGLPKSVEGLKIVQLG